MRYMKFGCLSTPGQGGESANSLSAESGGCTSLGLRRLRNMRILHFDTDDLSNPQRGGQPVRTFKVASRMAHRHEIKVFTATYNGSQRHRRRGTVDYRTLGFGIRGFGLSHHLTFLAAIGPTIRTTAHDLVVEEFMPPIGFCLSPAWTRQPVVSIVQWFFFKHWESRYKLPFEKMMRRTSAHIDYRDFIVQSRRMAEYFRAMVPRARVHLIPCGIDADEYSGELSPGSYALYLGRLDIEQKGLDTLLEIWADLRHQGQAIPLRIAGAGPAAEWLQKRIGELGMLDLVSLVGRVEGDAKSTLLRNCRFLVMPSREETFGLTALEAMGRSKPVVAFDIDNLNEIVRPDWGVLAKDRTGFAKAVLDLWRHPDICMNLGAKAHVAAQDYSWDLVAARQQALYEDIVNDRERK